MRIAAVAFQKQFQLMRALFCKISGDGVFNKEGRKFVITMTPEFDPAFFARTAPHFLEHIEVGVR
jgi:hypothetical protein